MAKKSNDKGKQGQTLDMSDLSRTYRADTQEQPPSHLDAAILSEARRAVGGSHSPLRSNGPLGSTWFAPLSAAAVMVLSVVLVIFMGREAPLQEQVLSDAPATDVYSNENSRFSQRADKTARAEAPPAAPAPGAAGAPAVVDDARVKKESRADSKTSTAPMVIARERANDAVEAKSAAPTASADNRSARVLTQPTTVRSVDLRVGNRIIHAALASTNTERERGLMHRDQLAPDAGMLFLFPPRSTGVCMWMKDTRIPLSAAFLDRHGAVLKIADMQPFSETPHCADGEVRFVLELNQGVFTTAGVKPGTRIGGLPPLQD